MSDKLSPWEASRQREQWICNGLVELAAKFGHVISKPQIDANGEIMFSVAPACYGEGLAAILSNYPLRTGISPRTGTVDPRNGWGRLNHFDAEKLILIDAGREINYFIKK